MTRNKCSSRRAGLKSITKAASEKEGATVGDAQNLTEEIKQAAANYSEKKAQLEKTKQEDEERKAKLKGAFADVDGEIDSLKL